MKRGLTPTSIIAGILFFLLASSVAFAHDGYPLRSRYGNVVVVERYHAIRPYVDPYRCVTPSYRWYFDSRPGYVHRPYHPGYDPRDAYGTRGFGHRPSWAIGFSIGPW